MKRSERWPGHERIIDPEVCERPIWICRQGINNGLFYSCSYNDLNFIIYVHLYRVHTFSYSLHNYLDYEATSHRPHTNSAWMNYVTHYFFWHLMN